MAKSMRSKRKNRLRAIRRDIVATELIVLKKEVAKLAAQEACLAASKLIAIIPGRNAFQLRSSSGGVTRTCEIQRTRLKDGQILYVIDTPGFDFNAESRLVVNETGKCIDLADDGVHVFLFVLSVRTSFSKEEQVAMQYFKKFFGTKISDYMIVAYTGVEKLEDIDSLNDQLDCSHPEDLKEALKMCGYRQVLFDNKT
ncbi:hypothetical protein RDI58_017706 [Solanum bulbocastanum]|uniref:AIG1-type G domain-containing protein n=1 Tax=Solanum bulbocastanum TaxID=147425 RepID=A0AAN8TFY1_SOLBU